MLYFLIACKPNDDKYNFSMKLFCPNTIWGLCQYGPDYNHSAFIHKFTHETTLQLWYLFMDTSLQLQVLRNILLI